MTGQRDANWVPDLRTEEKRNRLLWGGGRGPFLRALEAATGAEGAAVEAAEVGAGLAALRCTVMGISWQRGSMCAGIIRGETDRWSCSLPPATMLFNSVA